MPEVERCHNVAIMLRFLFILTRSWRLAQKPSCIFFVSAWLLSQSYALAKSPGDTSQLPKRFSVEIQASRDSRTAIPSQPKINCAPEWLREIKRKDGRNIFSSPSLMHSAELLRLAATTVDLRNCDLSGRRILKIEKNTIIPVTISGVDLSGVTFRGSTIEGVHFVDCNLSNCDFSSTLFILTEFTNCNLSGTTFSRAFSGFCTAPELLTFRNCRMHNVTFSLAELKGAVFEACSLAESDFSNALLNGCAFANCDLPKSKWSCTYLKSISLRNVSMAGATFDQANREQICKSAKPVFEPFRGKHGDLLPVPEFRDGFVSLSGVWTVQINMPRQFSFRNGSGQLTVIWLNGDQHPTNVVNGVDWGKWYDTVTRFFVDSYRPSGEGAIRARIEWPSDGRPQIMGFSQPETLAPNNLHLPIPAHLKAGVTNLVDALAQNGQLQPPAVDDAPYSIILDPDFMSVNTARFKGH